jgi:putative oxidoreductase
VNGPAVFGRVVLGGYLAVHGAQKLFGSFGGRGLDATAAGFERLGLTPAREMALLAGVSELGGGVLTATGIADPLGPLALAGSMVVATLVHHRNGPLQSKGGFELPLTNLALAGLLGTAAAGPGLGPRLPRPVARAALVAAGALTAVSAAKVLRTALRPAAPTAGGPGTTSPPAAAGGGGATADTGTGVGR